MMKKYLLLFVLSCSYIFGQYNEFNPGYNWLTIEGENNVVHFHEEAERSAKVVLKIAEEVWGPITSLYGYEPEKVHWVIKDIDDYANGATYFFDNKIEIWASSLDFELRGAHNWLRNVISHEFTHMVQIQSAMKTTRSIPAVYLQVLSYEDTYRPDILYGYPNVIASYPFAMVNVPAWFAEGTAQYMRQEFNYDNWDTHRDMILRSYALDNKMLTWNQMGVFNKTSLGNESVYNAGFALTRYLAQEYGEDKIAQITKRLGDFGNFTIDAAFKDVLGKDGNQIYDEWSSMLKENYAERTAAIKENFVAGDTIAKVGFGNFHPNFSPDGKNIVYISNKTADYMGLSSVYSYNIDTKKEKQLISRVRSTVSYIPGTRKVVYAQLGDDNPNWVNIHDLYVYDIDQDEETRLTFGLRANNPDVAPDGKHIVFLYQKDGTTNLGTVDIEGKNFKRITFFENGEQVYNPKYSQDGTSIIFDYSYGNTRDIATVKSDGTGFDFLIKTEFDDRNPTFDSNGNIVYASDRTGIFNLYRRNIKTQKDEQLTNVTGGAFMPTVKANGDIAYAGYTSDGYKIFYITPQEQEKVNEEKKYIKLNNPPLGSFKSKGDLANFDLKRLQNYNDYDVPDYEKKPYSGFFSRMTFFPAVRYDNYNPQNSGIDKIKPGVYLSSSDILNRYSIFAGGFINAKFERDLFFQFEFRNKLPILYSLGLKPDVSLELYSVSRKADVDIFFGVDSTYTPPRYDYKIPVGVTFDLFEFDIAFKHRIFSDNTNLDLRFVFSEYTSKIGEFVLPNTTTLYPSTKDTYFVGRDIRLTFHHDGRIPHRYSDINPIGRVVDIRYDYEFNKFNNDNEYVIEDGLLKPKYNNFNFHRLELNWKEYYETFKFHTLTVQARLGTIFGPAVPDFFDFYLGGLVGMKSYPFYSVSGNELAWLNLTYRVPIFKEMDTRLGHLYLDKLFLSFFADIGDAWTGDKPSAFKNFKKGAGAELRLKMNSFYLFPTSVFFSAAYSFDEFDRIVYGETVHYGKEWRLYGGILFDFNF